MIGYADNFNTVGEKHTSEGVIHPRGVADFRTACDALPEVCEIPLYLPIYHRHGI
jgi:hypothetical protein